MPVHRHPSSAFIVGYILSGAIRRRVDDGPVPVIFIADTTETALTTFDRQ